MRSGVSGLKLLVMAPRERNDEVNGVGDKYEKKCPLRPLQCFLVGLVFWVSDILLRAVWRINRGVAHASFSLSRRCVPRRTRKPTACRLPCPVSSICSRILAVLCCRLAFFVFLVLKCIRSFEMMRRFGRFDVGQRCTTRVASMKTDQK